MRVKLADFFNYMLFCGAAWTGMSHEYRAFDDFINEKNDFKSIPKNKLFGHAFTRFSHLLLCLVCLLVIVHFVNYDHLLTEEWATSPLPYRFGYIIAAVHIKAFIMFVGMSAMEANFIACGQGYTPAKLNEKGEVIEPENFNSIRNVGLLAVQTQKNWNKAVAGWNSSVHYWLKYYVMMPLMDKKIPRG